MELPQDFRSYRPYFATQWRFNHRKGLPYRGRLEQLLKPSDVVTCYSPQENLAVGGITLEDYLEKYELKGFTHLEEAHRFEKQERPSYRPQEPLLGRSKLSKGEEQLIQLLEGRNTAFDLYGYWCGRTLNGDPLLDKFMEETMKAALRAVLALDQALVGEYWGLTEDDEDYPTLGDECYQLSKVIEL